MDLIFQNPTFEKLFKMKTYILNQRKVFHQLKEKHSRLHQETEGSKKRKEGGGGGGGGSGDK